MDHIRFAGGCCGPCTCSSGCCGSGACGAGAVVEVIASFSGVLEMGACPLTEPEALCSGFGGKRVEGEEGGQAATAETDVSKVQLHCGAGPGAARLGYFARVMLGGGMEETLHVHVRTAQSSRINERSRPALGTWNTEP